MHIRSLFLSVAFLSTLAVLPAQAAVHPMKTASFQPFPGTPNSDTAAVIDVNSGKFLYREQAKKKRSIASLTKMMTTMVFLETQPDLDKVVTYSRAYDREGTKVRLEEGDQLTLFDVMMSTLVLSANNMAATLAASTPMTQQEFVGQMNKRMQELDLKSTHLVEPTGLDTRNVSTAGNLARYARYAFPAHRAAYISSIRNPYYSFTLLNSQEKKTLAPTSAFPANDRFDILGVKTGYLPYDAYQTLVVEIRERSTGNDIIVVLLGNPKYGTIFQEAIDLAEWSFDNWEFQQE